MPILRNVLALTVAGTGLLFIAQPSYSQSGGDELTARTLYYDPGDAPKPVKHTVARREKPASPVTETAQAPHTATTPAAPQAPAAVPANADAMTAVAHLGVRYNLVLVSDDGSERAADPDSIFHRGDCLAIRAEANHDGYLYVIEQGSSGKWGVLLPSPEMTDESNLIRAHTAAKVPEHYCFAVDESPGTEHLFLVLSRNSEDIYQLNSAIKAKNDGGQAPETPDAGSVGSSVHPIGQQIAMLRLQSRDLTVKKIAKPVAAGEPVDAVYVVNTSNTPSDRIVTEIRLKHE